MTNTFFASDGPEEYDELYFKWMVLTPDELGEQNVHKVQCYLDLQTIDDIQDALELTITEGKGHGAEFSERRLMQLGIGLEELKDKLKKKKASRTLDIPD